MILQIYISICNMWKFFFCFLFFWIHIFSIPLHWWALKMKIKWYYIWRFVCISLMIQWVWTSFSKMSFIQHWWVFPWRCWFSCTFQVHTCGPRELPFALDEPRGRQKRCICLKHPDTANLKSAQVPQNCLPWHGQNQEWGWGYLRYLPQARICCFTLWSQNESFKNKQ